MSGSQDYFDAVLSTAISDIKRRIRVAVGEQRPHKVDTVLWYEPHEDGDPLGLGVFGGDVGAAGWSDGICDGMREAGMRACEQNVVVVAMSATLKAPDGEAVCARVYAALVDGDMLVQDGDARIDDTGAIVDVSWTGEPRRGTVGAGQPFLRSFWQGWEGAVAGRN